MNAASIPNPTIAHGLRTFSLTVGALAAAIGAIVLVGWRLDIEALQSVRTGMASMKPNTALSFLISGLALSLVQARRVRWHWVGLSFALLTALIAGLTLCEYASGVELRIDDVAFRVLRPGIDVPPQRMSVATAVCFCGSGCALAILHWGSEILVAQGLALLVALVSGVALTGYAYSVPQLYSVTIYSTIAVHTAVLHVLLGAATLCAVPERGLTSIFVGAGAAGTMARRLTPAALLTSPLLGLLIMGGSRIHLYAGDFSLALLAVATTVVFVTLVWRHSMLLHDSELQRRAVEEELRRRNDELGRRTEELERKTEEVEAFVYTVSHDLRAPLVNLQGFSRELEASCGELGDCVRAAEVPAAAGARMASLVNDDIGGALRYISAATSKFERLIEALLALSRAGYRQYSVVCIDVNEIVETTLDALRGSIDESGAQIITSDLPPVDGDALGIEQIFSNLIVNALHYLDPSRPGIVEIGGQREGGVLHYWVRDNGRGIPESSHAKVFRAFHRFHPGVAPGIGMGLAIVRRIVQQHDGKVWTESRESVGSTFHVTLPAPHTDDRGSVSEAGSPERERSTGTGRGD
jgi:signal transduction histidine kinase